MSSQQIYLTGALDYPGRQAMKEAAELLERKGYEAHCANLPLHELPCEERSDPTEICKLRTQVLIACDRVVTLDRWDTDGVSKHEVLWARCVGMPVDGIQAFLARHENGVQKANSE